MIRSVAVVGDSVGAVQCALALARMGAEVNLIASNKALSLDGNGSSDSSSSFGARRNMFTVTCSACGKSTEVPFEPRGDRPVYCSDCYRKVRVNR